MSFYRGNKTIFEILRENALQKQSARHSSSHLVYMASAYIAQCTLHSAPVPANAPASSPVHFILHIKHCTLHAIHLYQILHIYNFTLKPSNNCLSGTHNLHGKINIKIYCK